MTQAQIPGTSLHSCPGLASKGRPSCNLSQIIAAFHPDCACSAITLGRVAWVCPGQIAPHLAHFVGPWCSALRSIRDDVEKEHAFLGLCALLRANPEVLPRRPPNAWPSAFLALFLAPCGLSQRCLLGSGT